MKPSITMKAIFILSFTVLFCSYNIVSREVTSHKLNYLITIENFNEVYFCCFFFNHGIQNLKKLCLINSFYHLSSE